MISTLKVVDTAGTFVLVSDDDEVVGQGVAQASTRIGYVTLRFDWRTPEAKNGPVRVPIDWMKE